MVGGGFCPRRNSGRLVRTRRGAGRIIREHRQGSHSRVVWIRHRRSCAGYGKRVEARKVTGVAGEKGSEKARVGRRILRNGVALKINRSECAGRPEVSSVDGNIGGRPLKYARRGRRD